VLRIGTSLGWDECQAATLHGKYVMKVHAAEKKGMRKIIDSKMDLIVFTKLCDMKIIQSFVGRTLFSINGPEL